MTSQIYKMKCPHCGWIRVMKFDVDGGQVDVVKGIREDIERLWVTIQSPKNNETWFDAPACPKCDNPYQYNWETGETKP